MEKFDVSEVAGVQKGTTAVAKDVPEEGNRATDRRKKRVRDYYEENREAIRAHQREYYQKNKEKNTIRVREYRRKNREKVCEKRREYRAKNIERFREYDKKYNEKYKEQRKAYYEANKYILCYNRINRDCFKSMETIRQECPDRIKIYLECYPFEEYAERHIKKAIYRWNVYASHEQYADCYDAGMLAYMYSIHRCAMMNCDYTAAYIKKMIQVYVVCALVVSGETRNICKKNGFTEIRVDRTEVSNYF